MLEKYFYSTNKLKKQTSTIAIFATALLFSLIAAGINPAFSQSSTIANFSALSAKSEIVIGVRTAAYEIGHNVQENGSGGFCGSFGQELERTLSYQGIKIKYRPIENNYLDKRWERYDGLREDIIDVECGPNSLPVGSPDWARNIRFSPTVFHETGVKLLLKRSLLESLPSKRPSHSQIRDSMTIAAVEETTTLDLFYNKLEDLKIKPTDGRDEALDLLERNPDFAYASDALIVKTLLNRGEKGLVDANGNTILKDREPYRVDDYVIFPSNASYIGNLAEEKYVIAIRDNTAFSDELMEAVEDTLNTDFIKKKRAELKVAEAGSTASQPRDRLRLFEYLPYIVAVTLLLLAMWAIWNIFRTPSVSIINHNQNNNVNSQNGLEQKELIESANEIKRILNSISSSSSPTGVTRAKARLKGAEAYEKKSHLRERILRGITKGAVEALKQQIQHPLAVFFIEGFEEARRG